MKPCRPREVKDIIKISYTNARKGLENVKEINKFKGLQANGIRLRAALRYWSCPYCRQCPPFVRLLAKCFRQSTAVNCTRSGCRVGRLRRGAIGKRGDTTERNGRRSASFRPKGIRVLH